MPGATKSLEERDPSVPRKNEMIRVDREDWWKILRTGTRHVVRAFEGTSKDWEARKPLEPEPFPCLAGLVMLELSPEAPFSQVETVVQSLGFPGDATISLCLVIDEGLKADQMRVQILFVG